MAKNSRQLRIISGKWGSRRFSFPAIDSIRPTPDKLRETLFNWLQFDIKEAVCLDLFAGSGALGLEALSRGAAHMDFVDLNRKACISIKQHLAALECTNATVYTSKAETFRIKKTYDIIFLDPPFHSDFLEKTLRILPRSPAIKKETLIFIETEQKEISENLTILKQADSGLSSIYLTQLKQA